MAFDPVREKKCTIKGKDILNKGLKGKKRTLTNEVTGKQSFIYNIVVNKNNQSKFV